MIATTEERLKQEVVILSRKYFKSMGHKLELVRHGMQYQLNVMSGDGQSVYQSFGGGDLKETAILLSGVKTMIKFIQSHPLNSEISTNLQSTYASCDNAIDGDWDKNDEGFKVMQECLSKSAAAYSKLTGTELILL
jgi:hypothetical protein